MSPTDQYFAWLMHRHPEEVAAIRERAARKDREPDLAAATYLAGENVRFQVEGSDPHTRLLSRIELMLQGVTERDPFSWGHLEFNPQADLHLDLAPDGTAWELFCDWAAQIDLRRLSRMIWDGADVGDAELPDFHALARSDRQPAQSEEVTH